MIVYHPLFERIEIPDSQTEIEKEIERCKDRFFAATGFDHYLQAKIDCLEDALDKKIWME